MSKPALLYLVHRIPYPPNKGDKVRSFHILQYLREIYDIYLGTFVDDPADMVHCAALQTVCAGSVFIPLHPARRRLASLPGVLGRRSLSEIIYRHRGMQDWVDTTINRHAIDKALIFSSVMGQFILPHQHRLQTVIDFVDMDSDKWRQYGAKKMWPANWVYQREARCLWQFELALTHASHKAVLVSSQEAALFRDHVAQVTPADAAKVTHVNNGVDVEYFDPERAMENPYQTRRIIVFTGAMDYWANVDAVCWFVQNIWPGIRRVVSDARFYIVGARPNAMVQALHGNNQVYVTGRVEDIRPYIRYAALAIAPLRIARGVQNKVLEAMAMAKYVVASQAAMEGIENPPPQAFVQADNEQQWCQSCIRVLQDQPQTVPQARDFIRRHYTWRDNLRKFQSLLEGDA